MSFKLYQSYVFFIYSVLFSHSALNQHLKFKFNEVILIPVKKFTVICWIIVDEQDDAYFIIIIKKV